MTSKCNICYNGKLSCSSIVHLESILKFRELSQLILLIKQDNTTGKFWLLFMYCYAFVYLNCHPFKAHGHYLCLITKKTNITAKNLGF